jgi:hypothetical protein
VNVEKERWKISISKERVGTTDALLRCGMKGECGNRKMEDMEVKVE